MAQRDPAEKIQGSGKIPTYLSAIGWKKEGDEDMGGNDLRAERKKIESWLLKTDAVSRIIAGMQMPPAKAAEVAAYDEAITKMHAISEDAEKIIGIVEKDIENVQDRIGILNQIMNGIMSGADCSGCEQLEDILKTSDLYEARRRMKLGEAVKKRIQISNENHTRK